MMDRYVFGPRSRFLIALTTIVVAQMVLFSLSGWETPIIF